MGHLLIIGHVWPEPNSSAAGSRMLQLIHLFLEQQWDITFASTATESDHAIDLKKIAISTQLVKINDPSFDDFIRDICPNIVVFDRFMTEEQFGWRVAKHCPNALRILNTEDLHCLRKSRQQSIRSGIPFDYTALKKEDITKREIASIYRSDISFIISEFEIKLLQEQFAIPKSILLYIPFLLEPISQENIEVFPTYEERLHFITIGNFRHDPNWDSFLYLKETLWSMIRKQLPDTELHIYGAYPPPKAMQLQNPEEGIYLKGWAKSATSVMKNARVCLAPLRFGAGIKGKLAESMCCGTPNVTTTIGAEGMSNDDGHWNGIISDNPNEFADAAVELYTNQNVWIQAQQYGLQIINTRFTKDLFEQKCIDRIISVQNNLTAHRSSNFIGTMLQYHNMRSTEFMSRWIEEKNK